MNDSFAQPQAKPSRFSTTREQSLPDNVQSLPRCGEDPLLLLHHHAARVYGATVVCVKLLERWYELGIRPGNDNHREEEEEEDYSTSSHLLLSVMSRVLARAEANIQTAEDPQQQLKSDAKNSNTPASAAVLLEKLAKNPIDNVQLLYHVLQLVTRLAWRLAPGPSADAHLQVQPSRIGQAQQGLFCVQDLPRHAICCYYTGNVHSMALSQRLDDASYVLRIGPTATRPWWYKALCDDDDDDDNDDDQEKESTPIALLVETQNNKVQCKNKDSDYTLLRHAWDKIIQDSTRHDFFVNPTNLDIKARYMNDCVMDTDQYNVTFVMDPVGERAAVVTLRDILAGEELYVSYGQAYWESLQATTGIVPGKINASS